MIKSIIHIAVSLFFVNTAVLAQTMFYVSPKGKNTNPGTKEKPFASIDYAKLQAWELKEFVVINLLGGIYYLDQPVVFTPEDSRRGNESLTITNFKNQKVTVSGVVTLKLIWKKYKNGIWQAKVEHDVFFDELFVNRQLQRMARYPNFDPAARFLGGTSADAIARERTADWQSPAGGYVHALHGSEWGDFHYIITGRNDKGELTLEGGWQNNRRMGMHKKHCVVENNIMISNTFHPHVCFKNSNDVFCHNIVSAGYLPINVSVWGKVTDYNIFPDSASLNAVQRRGTDKNSVCGDLLFVNAQNGDFRLKDGSVAFSTGFKSFAMDSFSVLSPHLRALSKKVLIPSVITSGKTGEDAVTDFLGAKVKNLSTEGERSATGMDRSRGVFVVEVKTGTKASGFLQANDVILSFNNRPVNNLHDLLFSKT